MSDELTKEVMQELHALHFEYGPAEIDGIFSAKITTVIATLRDQLAASEARVKELEEALEMLVDAQNGPPLLGPKWEPFWNEAMDKARAALDGGKEDKDEMVI